MANEIMVEGGILADLSPEVGLRHAFDHLLTFEQIDPKDAGLAHGSNFNPEVALWCGTAWLREVRLAEAAEFARETWGIDLLVNKVG